MKPKLVDLTKKNWETLNELGIVDGHGNGFANTSKEFDDLVSLSRTPKYVQVKNSIFRVSYVDGCFYPIWYKVQYCIEFTPYTVEVLKRKENVLVSEYKEIGYIN